MSTPHPDTAPAAPRTKAEPPVTGCRNWLPGCMDPAAKEVAREAAGGAAGEASAVSYEGWVATAAVCGAGSQAPTSECLRQRAQTHRVGPS